MHSARTPGRAGAHVADRCTAHGATVHTMAAVDMLARCNGKGRPIMSVRIFHSSHKCGAPRWRHYPALITPCGSPAKWSHDGRYYCGRHDPDRIKLRREHAATRRAARKLEVDKASARARKGHAGRVKKAASTKRDIKALLLLIASVPHDMPHPWSEIQFEANRLRGIFK